MPITRREPAVTDDFPSALAASLHGLVAGDPATLAAYSTDASNHRVLPRCVAFPRDSDDVVALIDVCRTAGVPVTSRGAGTGLAGSALGSGVVVDYSRSFNRIVSVDPDRRTAVVEPGVVLDALQRQAQPFGLRFGPDPATHSRCTLGGMIGTDACGARALAWGTTSANVISLEVVLANGTTTTLGAGATSSSDDVAGLARVGERWATPIAAELGRFPRQVSGYALQHLLPGPGFSPARAFVGSEGTLAQVVRATLRLVPLPETRMLVVGGFADIVAAAAAAPAVAALHPLTVEGMGADLVAAYDAGAGVGDRRPSLPAGEAWVLVEVGGTTAECREQSSAIDSCLSECGAVATRVVTPEPEQRALWQLREQSTGLASRAGGVERWPGFEDAAVPPEHLAAYLADFTALLRDFGRTGSLYGHFGEGCVHVRIDHDLMTAAGRRKYADFQTAAADLVVEHGGSLSGEHGDGRQRSALLSRMYSPSVLEAFAAAKAVFDPDNLFNPGLIVDPVPLSRDLRLSIARPHSAGLAFAYADDGGDFGRASRRCVGVGTCLASGAGMCPSYQATRDERHSTRGRARVLFEMLDGSLASDGWRSPAAKEALDLCLMCKACDRECPASVDMATYKAEFLHHHYRRRLRPRSHLSLGWSPLLLAAGRRLPGLANAIVRSPGLSALARRLAGIDADRQLPELATTPVRRSGVRSPARDSAAGEPIVLWLDTFTSSFAPSVVDDATAVLGSAGYRVEVAGARLCCGLTWVSTGQLGVARAVMARTVAALDATGDACPVVVLEPSCASSLRIDTVKLLDSDASRRVAARIHTFAEALIRRNADWAAGGGAPAVIPELAIPTPATDPARPLLVQFHCHQRATLGTEADLTLLRSLGYDVTTVEEGCCGLAGNFGFEDGHLDVSQRCAEQSFLPYLERDASSPILADGFSCRLQMLQLGRDQLAGREPMHLATLLRPQLQRPR
jgi:FAD/FMN-containing dehydrogenase/Fe-S oxidoreductase